MMTAATTAPRRRNLGWAAPFPASGESNRGVAGGASITSVPLLDGGFMAREFYAVTPGADRPLVPGTGLTSTGLGTAARRCNTLNTTGTKNSVAKVANTR